MSDPTDDAGAEPLDDNLRRLLRVAPPRERLGAGGHERIAAALRDAAAPARPRSTMGPLTEAGRRWTPWAAAAAALLVGLVAWLVLGEGGPESTGEDPAPPTSPVAGAPGSPGADPSSAPPQPADGDGRMAVAGPDPASEPAPPTALLLEGTLRLGEGLASPPETVEIWVRPVVDLPRVADAERFLVPWGSGTSLPFALTDALGAAQRYGTTRVLVHAEAQGAGSAAATATLGPAGISGLDLVLAGEWSASGYVTDAATGAPVAGALVVAVDQVPFDALAVNPVEPAEIPDPHGVTDAAGRYVLRGLRRGQRARLRASAPGYAPSWAPAVESDAAATTELVADLALAPGGSVEGLVERADGTRWPGVLVIVSRQDFDPAGGPRPLLTYAHASTDASGRYVAEDLPEGTYVVLHFGDGRDPFAEPRAFQMIQVARGERTRVDFPGGGAAPGALLRGVLHDGAGAPLSGRSLTLSRADARAESESEWVATTTDERGGFRFAALPEGPHALHLADDGFAELTLVWSGEVSGTVELELTLPSAGVTLVGTGGGGTAGAWAMLERLAPHRGSWEFAGFSRSLGGAEVPFAHLPPGRYRGVFAPFDPGLAVVHVEPFDLGAEGSLRVPVALAAGATLTVDVTDSRGAPREGLELVVLGPEGRQVPQRETARTDAAGRVVVLGVPLGSIELRLLGAEGHVAASRTLEFTADAPGSTGPLPWALP